VHTFFLLSALLLAASVGGIGAGLLRLAPVTGRRPLAFVVLGTPPVIMSLAITHLIARFWPACAPLVGWDRVASFALLGSLGGVALGALGLNLARLALVERLLGACQPIADEALLARVAALAERLGTRAPGVRLLESDAPLAVAGGLRRPSIVLSSWLVEHLDARELEAVLTHELAHLAQRDDLQRWLGRALRDAMAYLPGGWYALRALETDEELSADALAVEATRRPLAMASALGKVWQSVLATPRTAGFAGVPGYAGASPALLEERLKRLLEGRARRSAPLPGRLLAGTSLVWVAEFAPRLLAASAAALPLMCTLPH
jgi:Zn-dependent protease with chaperone function